MSSNWPIVCSAAIAFCVGTRHLQFSLSGSKLHPQDPHLVDALRAAPLQVSPHTDMWRAWIGFNASHSLGLMLFGLVYGALALVDLRALSQPVVAAAGALFLVAIVAVARRYWFTAPFVVMLLVLGLYLGGLASAYL